MKIAYGNELVNELRKRCDQIEKRLWIAVPYIGAINSVRRIIGKKWIDDSRISVRLLTDTNEFNQINSETIKLFYQTGSLKHLIGLHAKIFITDDCCLITSANLTNTAFTKRHEIGIFLDKIHSLETISIFKNWWEKADPVTSIAINSKASQKFLEPFEEYTGLHLEELWGLPQEPEETNYWLKPIGVTANPITDELIFDKLTDYLHFSIYPKAVKINDILIGYGVGAKRMLSVYQVTSEPIELSDEELEDEEWMERWRWYVTAKNLTPEFGRDWSKYNLYASQMVNDYLKETPDGYITKVKGKTLGGLNFSRDKINLAPDFARYIIQKVKDCVLNGKVM